MKPEADVFKSLSDETRLRILNLLLNGSSLCVCEMVDALRIPQYQMSRHLVVLKNAGLVNFDKRGRWAYYVLTSSESANRELFRFLAGYLKGETFAGDLKRLALRLSLRNDDQCVVGFVSENEFVKLGRRGKNRAMEPASIEIASVENGVTNPANE